VPKTSLSEITPLVMGEYLNAFGILRSLGAKEVRSYVVSARRGMACYSRYVRRWFRVADPVEDSERCAEQIVRLGRRLGRLMVYPANAVWIDLIHRYRKEFDQAFVVPFPPAEVLRRCNDRLALNAAAKAAGLPVPATLQWTGEGDLTVMVRRVCEEMRFPVYVKPIEKGLAVKTIDTYTRMFTTAAKLRAWAEGVARAAERYKVQLAFQEHVGGPNGRLISAQGYMDRKGQLRAAVSYRKHRQHPPRNGSTLCAVIENDPEIIAACGAVLRQIGYHGLFDADFVRDPDTENLYCIDLNPRSGMVIFGATAAGVNLPWLQYADYADLPIGPEEVRFRSRCIWWRVLGDTLYYAIGGRRRYGVGWGEYLRSIRGPKAWADLDSRDIRPGLYEVARLPLRLLPRYRRVDT